METYSQTAIIKKLKKEGISLFSLADFSRIFAINNLNTLYKKIQRLEGSQIIKKLIKGKYLFLLGETNDFTIANFLYRPSYISLESALSFHGIITGFPYQITSVSIKKTKNYQVEGKEYNYVQINKDLFWGYEKKENFLIADKEKSLLDYLYFAFKGLRSGDLTEFDLSEIERPRFNKYKKNIKNKSFLKFLKKI
jgi:predicted transcriptional regulator of viral defense system